MEFPICVRSVEKKVLILEEVHANDVVLTRYPCAINIVTTVQKNWTVASIVE